MATKLSPYFVLCSTSNQNDLRGVTSHTEPDNIVVTVNRNMVSRYKVIEQRPLGSWSSRDGFSGSAVFDEVSKKYICLQHSKQLRLWEEEDVTLTKLKKHKFVSPIWQLVCSPTNEVFVVYECGQILPLSAAIECKKNGQASALNPNESILDCQVVEVKGTLYVVLICYNKDKLSHFVYIREKKDDQLEIIKKISFLSIQDKNLSGMALKSTGTLALLTFWSDGEIFSTALLSCDSEVDPRGSSLGKVDAVRADKSIAMTVLGNKHIAIYGADPNEEGAILLIYNSQFRVVQAKQRMKLYNSPPLMWGPFGNHLIIASGNHLLVSRFQIGQETLASMIGSANRKNIDSSKSVHHVTWGEKKTEDKASPFSSVPASISESITSMCQIGLTEAEMAKRLLPPLIEKRDSIAILWCLRELREVPEQVLGKLASFCLQAPESTFASLMPSGQAQLENPAADETSACLPPESPLKGGRRVLLDAILEVPFSSARMLPEIRRNLAPQDCILLLEHASARLWHGDQPTENTESQLTQLLAWICALLDANYQHCLISKDTQILPTLSALSTIVDTQISHIEALRELQPILLRMQQGRKLPKLKDQDQRYSIETVFLY